MKLGAWLNQKGITRDAFAVRIATTAASVTRYVNGERVPRPRIMKRITEVTDGQVTANDFIGVQEPIPNVTAPPTATAAE